MNAETRGTRKQVDVKQVLAVILAFVAISFAAWDGSTTLEPSTTSIDGRQYYAIGSPEELAWFANKVNSRDTAISAILTADIDLKSQDWTPIGKDSICAFDGIFDGDGHNISGIRVSNRNHAGLFGVLDIGTIKNLVIESSTINGNRYVGGVVGLALENSCIQNVVNKASVQSSGRYSDRYLGGIVGYAKYSKIVECVNEGVLSAGRSVGGIVGYAYSTKLNNLKNTGSIKGGVYTGGIIGDGEPFYQDTIVSNAVNSGDVAGYRFVGGICGRCNYEITREYGFIRNCANEGLIKGIGGTKDSLRVGGICGICSVISSRNQGNIDVEGTCIQNNVFVGGISGKSKSVNFALNYGNISATMDSTLFVGGVSGFVDGLSFVGNFGDVKASTTRNTQKAYVGGVAGYVAGGIGNAFNQGTLHSSYYAAGITTVLPQKSINIRNFYVATDSIDSPNAAVFVNYNSVTATLQNGYFDSTLLKNLPLVGENLGVEKNLFGTDTKSLQSDSFAYELDMANYVTYFSGPGYYDWLNYKSSFYKDCRRYSECYYHWSRDDGYPIFADSLHNPIYQITFVTKNNCSVLNCDADSSKRYTNYKGFVDSIPELTEDYIWVINNRKFNTLDLKKYVFSWQDTLVVASYQNLSSSSSNQNNVSSSSKENIVRAKDELPNCNSKRFGIVYYVEEDDSDYKCEDYKWISLSNPQTISNVDMVFLPKVFANGQSIWIENMNSRERIVVFDAQGRIVKNTMVPSSMKIPVPFAGRYFVMIGKSIMAIDVK